MIITNCPSCGHPLDHSNQIGRSLCCPACRCQFLYQEGVTTMPQIKFLVGKLSWKETIDKCFYDIISNSDKTSAKDIQILECKEIYEPYVETVSSENGLRWLEMKPVGVNRIEEIPLDNQPYHYKKIETINREDINKSEIDPFDDIYLDSLRKKLPFVEDSILYVPVRLISFKCRNIKYDFVAYDENIVFLDEQPFDLAIKQKEKESKLPLWVRMVIGAFIALVIIMAWYKFCYIYFHFHGFNIIIMSNGYKCFLPFLGTLLVSLAGYGWICDSIKYLIERKDEEGYTVTQRMIKKSLYRKCNI